jgi:hypothetical protein
MRVTLEHFESNPSEDVIHKVYPGYAEIKLLDWGDWMIEENQFELDAFMGCKSGADNWDYNCTKLKEFCKQHSVHYYARPRETFFMSDAFKEAESKGVKYLLVEDLS